MSVFVPPHRFAISWTLAFLELPLRRPLVLPYVFLLLARYVHITVDPASVPVQQPGRCVERFALSPYGWQSLLHPCWLTMLLRRILEDVSIRPCVPYCFSQRSDRMLVVLSDHDPLPATGLHTFAHDAQRKSSSPPFSLVRLTLISSTVLSLSYRSLATCKSVRAARIAYTCVPRARLDSSWVSRRAFQVSLPRERGHYCSCYWNACSP